MNLTKFLISLYEEGDIKFDLVSEEAFYSAFGADELRSFWNKYMREFGPFDMRTLERTSAFYLLKRHHEAIDEDKSFMERLSSPEVQ